MGSQPEIETLLWSKGVARIAIDAFVCGALAIHGAAEAKPAEYGCFTLTHLPSGFKIAGGFSSLKKAKAAAEAIKDFDWSFNTPDAVPAETRQQMKAIISRLEK